MCVRSRGQNAIVGQDEGTKLFHEIRKERNVWNVMVSSPRSQSLTHPPEYGSVLTERSGGILVVGSREGMIEGSYQVGWWSATPGRLGRRGGEEKGPTTSITDQYFFVNKNDVVCILSE